MTGLFPKRPRRGPLAVVLDLALALTLSWILYILVVYHATLTRLAVTLVTAP